MSNVILIAGLPASGKSTASKRYSTFTRLNRDTEGGKVIDLLPKFEALLRDNKDIVLDNTYVTAESRKPFVEMAKKHKAKIECRYMSSTKEDAIFNAAYRIITKHNKLLEPEEIKKIKDPNTFPINVIWSMAKLWQKPDMSEGYNAVSEIKFQRQLPADWCNKALILDYDGTLRVTGSGEVYPKSPNDVIVLKGRERKLKEFKDDEYHLLGVSNQSGVASGHLTKEDATKCFEQTNKLLKHKIDYHFCPHRSSPPSCYCRKPQPGFGIYLMHKYKLNPAECIFVGDMTSDKTFATRCGFQFRWASEFFE